MLMRIASLGCVILLAVSASAGAQSRPPAAQEVAAIRGCATQYKDNLDDGDYQCLFKLVATPCINAATPGADAAMADCYEIEGAIWDQLLNENYKALLGTLDNQQTAQARAMQRAWIADRDATCRFYDDKIQGSMSIMMHAACVTRETAWRAMLLQFLSRL